MILSRLAKAKDGQMRILEAVIAVVIIFIVFSVSVFFISASNIRVLQETADLDRLGYNVLHRLVESGTVQEILAINITESRNAQLKTAVQKSLSLTTYFNITIYDLLDKGVKIDLNLTASSSNISTSDLAASSEISSTSMVYTAKDHIYYLVLVLARAGGG